MDMPASQRMYEPASVILKYHDGGSDHNVSHAQVQLACITEFLITGVDFLVSMRCVPGQSWTNPAERIMSSVNFGLQSVVVERDVADTPELENRLAKLASMSAIRSEFDKEPTAQEKITELTKKPKNRIAVALSSVHRNGEYFNVGPTALHSHIRHSRTSCMMTLWMTWWCQLSSRCPLPPKLP